MLTHVGESWNKLLKSTEDEGGDYNYEDLHDDCQLIKNLILTLSQAQVMEIKDYEVTQKTTPWTLS